MFADPKRVMMGGGLLAAVVLAMWTLWPVTPAPSASTAQAAGPGRGVPGQAQGAPVAPVKLDALSAGRREPSDGSRNPFRFQPKVAAPPPQQQIVETPGGAGVSEAPRASVPAGPPPPPPIPLKFIGILERANGVKWAVLSDGKVTMHGKDGDVVDGRYRIVKIGTESIELTYLDGRGRQVVRLTGQ
jgi:hypothetical protein